MKSGGLVIKEEKNKSQLNKKKKRTNKLVTGRQMRANWTDESRRRHSHNQKPGDPNKSLSSPSLLSLSLSHARSDTHTPNKRESPFAFQSNKVQWGGHRIMHFVHFEMEICLKTRKIVFTFPKEGIENDPVYFLCICGVSPTSAASLSGGGRERRHVVHIPANALAAPPRLNESFEPNNKTANIL